MCIVVINNAQISIQFSRKASEAPPWLMERKSTLTYLGPLRLRACEQTKGAPEAPIPYSCPSSS